ncbi:MAG: aspartate aminotransferase family protein [Thalassobaculales bacterium]
MPFQGNSDASRDIAFQVHPYTNQKAFQTEGPLIMTRGEGVFVYDDAGNSYLEAMAGLWSASLGFSEPRLVEAATRQMKQLPYYQIFAAKSHLPSIDLAEKLVKLAPVPMSKAFFQNSGSEANDTVMKIVWYVNNAWDRPRKKKIISRIKAYHGVTIASASLTGLPNNHRDFDLPIANVLHADCPHHYRFAEPGESEEEFATRLADNLEKLILREDPDTIAAFIGEPLMGAGGVIVPPRTYWEKVQAVLKKYDILLIADEVICGFCRTGNYWGSQTFGITPDMLSCAKALSASYLPISAVLMNDRIYQGLVTESEKIGTFGHGYTYSGHPVAAAVALETLAIYEERDILSHVRRVGPRMQEGLRRFLDHPLVGEVRGVGLIAGMELVKDKKTKQAFDPKAMVGTQLMKFAQGQGLIVRAMVDTIAFTPPMIISEEEIDLMLARLGEALDLTLGWARDKALV